MLQCWPSPLFAPLLRCTPNPALAEHKSAPAGGMWAESSVQRSHKVSSVAAISFPHKTESNEVLSHQRDNKLHWANGQLSWAAAPCRGVSQTPNSVLKALQVGAQASSQTFLVSTTAGNNWSAPVSRTRTVSISHYTPTWNRLFLRFPRSTQVTTK